MSAAEPVQTAHVSPKLQLLLVPPPLHLRLAPPLLPWYRKKQGDTRQARTCSCLSCCPTRMCAALMVAPPVPRQQRTCEFCDSGAVGSEQHLLMECAATDGARGAFPALFTQQPQPSMQQFLWQRERETVAKFVLMCLFSVGIITARTDST